MYIINGLCFFNNAIAYVGTVSNVWVCEREKEGKEGPTVFIIVS